jgi:NAD(P)-dependent dehydrogenase (short-subunit alcohol dehydrogenase family)
MKGRTVLVTGSTDGIGKATAMDLAHKGAKVLLHGRNSEKGRAVLEEIRRITGNDSLEFFRADFSSQRQVRMLAAEIKESQDKLHVLINNAGTFSQQRRLTEDGLEMTFAVNHLAPFLLTHELLDLLKDSTLKDNAPSRIVTVASIAHWDAKVDWTNLQGERRYDGFQAYALSKLGNILFTYALARRLKVQGTGVTANCLHPGVTRTKLLRAGFGDYPGAAPEEGAKTSVYLASSHDVENVSGLYFENRRPARSSPQSYGQELQERFWQVSMTLAKLA